MFLRFNTSLQQLQCEIEVTHKTVQRRIERFARALDSPSLDLVGPVEIDEVYVFSEKKGCERDQESRSRGLSRRGRGSYSGDKPPIFIITDRGTGQRYVIPAKAADESTIRLLLTDRKEESFTDYTDGFRAYEPLEEDDAFDREYVGHDDGEYADDVVLALDQWNVRSLSSYALLSETAFQQLLWHYRWNSRYSRFVRYALTRLTVCCSQTRISLYQGFYGGFTDATATVVCRRLAVTFI